MQERAQNDRKSERKRGHEHAHGRVLTGGESEHLRTNWQKGKAVPPHHILLLITARREQHLQKGTNARERHTRPTGELYTTEANILTGLWTLEPYETSAGRKGLPEECKSGLHTLPTPPPPPC